MTNRIVIACLALLGMLAVVLDLPPSTAGAPGAASPQAPAGKVGKPLMTLAGTDSGVTQRVYRRVPGDEQWAKLWTGHRSPDTGRDPRPQIDFDRCTLVAIFDGATSNTSAMEVASVTETADAVVVRFAFPGYATGGNVKPHEVTPFGFILLPKTDKPIVLEQNVGGGDKSVDGGKPDRAFEWREVARLAAAPAKAQ